MQIYEKLYGKLDLSQDLFTFLDLYYKYLYLFFL